MSTPAAASWRRWASAWTFATATSPTGSTSPPPTGRRSSTVASAGTCPRRSPGPSPTRSTTRLDLPGATFDLRATIEHRGALVIRTDDGTDAVGQRHQHRPRVPATRAIWASRWRRSNPWSSSPRRSTTPTQPAVPPDLTNAFVQGSAPIMDASEVNARRRAEGKLPGEPDPHQGWRRSSAQRSNRSRNGSGCRGDASWRCRSNAASRWRWGCSRSTPLGSTPSASEPTAEERYADWARAGRRRARGLPGAVHPHQGPRCARPRRACPGQARRHLGHRPRRSSVRSCRCWTATPSSPSPRTMPRRACGRPTRPTPSRWSSAGAPSGPTATSSFGEQACRDGSLGTLPRPGDPARAHARSVAEPPDRKFRTPDSVHRRILLRAIPPVADRGFGRGGNIQRR